jgi:hypothetical protein
VAAGVDADGAHDLECDQALEAAVAVAHVQIIRVGVGRVLEPLHRVEVLAAGHVQRFENERIEDAEDYGVGADAQGQSNDGGECKARRLGQLP